MSDLYGLGEFGMGGEPGSTLKPLSEYTTEELNKLRRMFGSPYGQADINRELFRRAQARSATAKAPIPSAEDLTSEAIRSTFPARLDAPAATPQPQPQPQQLQQPQQQDYFSQIMNLKPGGYKIPPFKPIDVAEVEKKIPQIPPREKEETFKADPYMAMLQTGLRILAAKPQLGQGAISQIAGPVLEGVSEFRGEKEKERTAKREEAKAAREDLYRQADTARSAAALSTQILTSNQNAAMQYAKMQQDAAQHGDAMALRRAELGLKALDSESERNLRNLTANMYKMRDPNQIIESLKPFDARMQEIEGLLRDPKLPPNQKLALEAERDRIGRNIDILQGTARDVVRSEAGMRNQLVRQLQTLDSSIARLAPSAMTPEAQQELIRLRQLRATLASLLGQEADTGPPSLPPPPKR